MSTASTANGVMEVRLLRPDQGSETFTLPEGATLADLLREAGGGIQAGNILIDGRPLEEVLILNSAMAITVVPEPPPSPAKGARQATPGRFVHAPTFEERVATARANREAELQAMLEESDKEANRRFALAEEVATFEAHLPGWGDHEGQFVLIKGRDVLGFYPSRDEALDAGYDQLGMVPMLVKQVLADEPIYNVDRIKL
jgi:hypothetical protein